MRSILVVVFVAGLLSGFSRIAELASIPAKGALVSAATANGASEAFFESYNSADRVVVVSTPGWEPEGKPYQFDGANWVPLWSPFLN